MVAQTQVQEKRDQAKTPECILCGWGQTKFSRTGIREDSKRPVYHCPRCLLHFIDRPEHDLREFYRNEYRKTSDYRLGERMTPEERFKMMRLPMDEPARKFKELVPPGCSVLEVGCSSGYFLDALQGDYDVYGNEWNPEDAAYVRDVGEIPCEEGDLSEVFPGQQFGAIVALQVLEHQPDPLAWLRLAKSRLIGGGYLYLEVPNANEVLLTAYNIPEYKDFYFREAHVTYWQAETLAAALGSVGFETRVSYRQRYGLANHINWFLHHEPMGDALSGMRYLTPIDRDHPASAILNRTTAKLDREYRSQMETLRCSDTLTGLGRRQEI